MSAEATVQQRQGTHGEYADSAPVMQAIKRAIRSGVNYEGLPDIMKESLDLFAHKIGRIVTGNPYVLDHWVDIGGYSLLIQQRITDGVGVKKEYSQSDIYLDPFGVAAKTTLDVVAEPAPPLTSDIEKRYQAALGRLSRGEVREVITKRDVAGELLGFQELGNMPARTPEDDGAQHARQAPTGMTGGAARQGPIGSSSVVPKHGNIWLTDDDLGKQFVTYGRDLITLEKNIGGKQELYPYQCNNGRRYSTTGYASEVDVGEFDTPGFFNIEGRMPA